MEGVPCESSDVYYCVRLELCGSVVQRIGEDETTFSISIINLDSCTVHGVDDVSGFGCSRAGHVF